MCIVHSSISETGYFLVQAKINEIVQCTQVNVLMATVDGASLSGGSFCPFNRRRLGWVTRTLENSTKSLCSTMS